MKKTFILLIAALLSPMLAAAAPGLTSGVSELPLQLNDEKDLKVSLTDGASYKAIQFDVRVPEGVTIPDGGVTLAAGCIADHQLAMNKLTSVANTYRVLVQSPTNSAFTSGTDIFTVKFRSDDTLRGGKITFTNILMIDKATPTETKAQADLVITIPDMNPVISLSITGAAPVFIDESVQLAAVGSPEDAAWQELKWESSDPAVASVSADGLVTGLKEGTVTITATAVTFNKNVTATATVEVKGYRYGDANGDATLTLADVNAVIAYILEMNPQPFSFPKADMNKDGNISVADVTMITDELLKQPSDIAAQFPRKDARFLGAMQKTESGYELLISLESTLDVNALQADLTLPEGLSVSGVSLCGEKGADECVATSVTAEGATRFIVYSPALTRLDNAGKPMLRVALAAAEGVDEDAEVKIASAYASNLNDGDFGMDGFVGKIGTMLGVDTIGSEADGEAEYYTIEGLRVNDPGKGIYIVRKGGKVFKTIRTR